MFELIAMLAGIIGGTNEDKSNCSLQPVYDLDWNIIGYQIVCNQ